MSMNTYTRMRGPCRLCGVEFHDNIGKPTLCKSCDFAETICWPNSELDETSITNRDVLLRRLSLVVAAYPPSFQETTYREHFENSYRERIRQIYLCQHYSQPVPEKLKRPFNLKPDGTLKASNLPMPVPGHKQKRADVDEKPKRGTEVKPPPKRIKL